MDRSLISGSAPGRLVPTIQGASAYVPDPLPPAISLEAIFTEYGEAIFTEYGEAMAGIGTLNAKIAQLGNPALIIRPLQRREALLSSAMEGTYTTSDELALLEAGEEASASADTREVRNYRVALENAVAMMADLPICHRLIQETHRTLLGGLPRGRGGNKRPGEYKTDQNWIGGATIASARFVPPPPMEAQGAMDDLEAFINRDGKPLPPLVEAALVHYQFETIHPFADGNGRVGRILIPLLLLSRSLIQTPAFYPSASLEERKDEYIDKMFAASTQGDWTGWLRFFLEICRATCFQSVAVIDRLLSLQNRYRSDAMARFRSNNVLVVIDYLFSNPIVSTPIVRDLLHVTSRAARMTIASLEELGILSKLEAPLRPEYFVARDILRAEA